jgi:hypothetical protein
MIVETKQPITCGFSTKSEILSDHAAPGAEAPRASPPTALTALTVTTHHFSPRHYVAWQPSAGAACVKRSVAAVNRLIPLSPPPVGSGG